MAKNVKKIAKSTIGSSSAALRDLQLLFYSWVSCATTRKVSWHAHPIWQAEYVTKGPIGIRTESFTRTLNRGDLLLLPPRTYHEFEYPENNVQWITCRFTATLDVTNHPVLVADERLRQILTVLPSFLDMEGNADEPSLLAAAGLLVSAVSLTYTPLIEQGIISQTLVDRVEAIIDGHLGEGLKVGQIANELGYSVSHVSGEFKRLTGKTLKAVIDESRAEHARKMIQFTDHSMGSIADAMGFDDVYAFSRFVKRMLGESPRQVRSHAIR